MIGLTETMSVEQQVNVIDGIDRLLKIKGVGDHTRRAILKDIGILSNQDAGALPCCGRIADALVECVDEPSDRLDREHDLNSCGDSPHQE